MQPYYGTKQVNAEPMTRLEYNQFRGWELPADENGDDEGYLVEYMDGGKPNHPQYIGYISWSPKEVFEKAYQPFTAMNFGHALAALKVGLTVTRQGWNGKGMFLFLAANAPGFAPFIAINTGSEVLPWTGSQADAMANDWMVTT